MICVNCKRILPDQSKHVFLQIDCRTGEQFIPTKRIVGQSELIGGDFVDLSTESDLWPEDYVCGIA